MASEWAKPSREVINRNTNTYKNSAFEFRLRQKWVGPVFEFASWFGQGALVLVISPLGIVSFATTTLTLDITYCVLSQWPINWSSLARCHGSSGTVVQAFPGYFRCLFPFFVYFSTYYSSRRWGLPCPLGCHDRLSSRPDLVLYPASLGHLCLLY